MRSTTPARPRVLTVLLLAVATLTAMIATIAPAQARSSYIVLAPGDRGSRVVALQRYLHVRPTSGYYGPITKAAVKRWQAAHHRRRTGLTGKYLWHSVRHTPARTAAPSRSSDRVTRLNWRALARCESSGNPRAVNPAGYYGLYQFDVRTWRSVGGQGMPHRASATEQTRAAQTLFRRSGSRPWPHCGRHLFD